MRRKLVRAGGSLAVTIPADVVQDLGLRPGMAVDVTVHPQTGVVTIHPGPRYVEGGRVTKRFERALDELMERRAALYRRLAR